MLRFVCALSLLLSAGSNAIAGALPVESSPSWFAEGIAPQERRPPPRDKWLRVGLIWGSTVADLISTRHALSNNPAMRESNPMLATNDGRFRTGVYVGVSLPLNALATYVNLKYPHSRSIRILTYVTTLGKCGIAAQNFKRGK